MIGGAKLMAFVATTDAARALRFYEHTLGLRFVEDDGFALVFDAAGVTLRVQKVERVEPHAYTTLGWQVASVRDEVAALTARGVAFERYPFIEQDGLGIWSAPGGRARVAWFKDPDGNLLSLSESGAA